MLMRTKPDRPCAHFVCGVITWCAESQGHSSLRRKHRALRLLNRFPDRLENLGQCPLSYVRGQCIQYPVFLPICLSSGRGPNFLTVFILLSLVELLAKIANF